MLPNRPMLRFVRWGLTCSTSSLTPCEAVKKTLEKERSTLESQKLQFPEVAEGTAVHDLKTNLTSLTDPSSVNRLARLTEAEKARIDEIRKRIRDLKSDDPERIARGIELRAKRMKMLVPRITNALEALSDTLIEELFSARDEKNDARRVVEALQRETFQEQPLPNTGSDAWRILWNAAERFSKTDAFPDQTFPFTGEDSRCVLCQQELTEEGVQRFRQFQEFLSSTAQGEYDRSTARYEERHKHFNDVLVLDEKVLEALEELKLDDADFSEEIRACLEEVEIRRNNMNTALAEGEPASGDLPVRSLNLHVLTNYIESLESRAKELRNSDHPEAISNLSRELNELEARHILADNLGNVLEEIERKKKIAAYQMCIDESRTNAITRKSSEVTKRAVTQQLTRSFSEELEGLRFHHVEIQMVAAGGSRGALYHKLQLRRAPGAEVSKVVSEGEARCLSIASFFAELSTAAERSAILFDDPVSSLDHNWRSNVAERLVVGAQSRQVIVFTHDIVFLHELVEKADKVGVELKRQYLRRGQTGAGLSSQQLPWPAIKVSARISHLNALWQDVERTLRKGDQGKYEKDASYIYGLLREAWERGVEEVLLPGTVERYRNSVQTMRASQLSDICPEDCKALDAGMTRCSKWIAGHDQSAADNSPFPEPSEVKADIKAFDEWINRIRKRRKNPR